jgi:hypothetical protein
MKQLLKKYSSLEEDLDVAKKNAIELFHLHQLNNQSIFPVPKFFTEHCQIHKIKKFACKALKGKGAKSGIRVIYAYFPLDKTVDFLEIYYKKTGDADMDYKRTTEYFNALLLP